jgi:hexokinase
LHENHGRVLTRSCRGGTNLRVGFVELLADVAGESRNEGASVNGEGLSSFALNSPRLRRLLERSWPIGEQLKDSNPDNLFDFIGDCISVVVQQACKDWDLKPDDELPLGVTFSFPMEQQSLQEATLMPMGKGFALDCKVDLGACLIAGYEEHRSTNLPRIRVAAIANDAVASLVSFVYQYRAKPNQKAVMSLICGTGTNATIPLKLSTLKESKRPKTVSVIPGQAGNDVKIAVNTEWSINGTQIVLSSCGIITRWDTLLNMSVEKPGFQPLEYMTSGRYLGELGRIIFEEYLTRVLKYNIFQLPFKLRDPFSMSTTFLSHYKPWDDKDGTLVEQLRREFPIPKENAKSSIGEPLEWTPEIAEALYRIALAIEVRAAGLMAAYTIGLLTLSEDLPGPVQKDFVEPRFQTVEYAVGYTGGCITGFQNYLRDCQGFLDRVMAREHGKKFRIILSPCHDGGITGAGILNATSLHSEKN